VSWQKEVQKWKVEIEVTLNVVKKPLDPGGLLRYRYLKSSPHTNYV
jgi:hypothetical protein